MSLMGSPQWAYASGEAFTVDQSLRFDKARTTYLRRDNASASTNGQKFTISCWVKHSGHPQSLGGSYDANGRPICCSVEQDENEDVFQIYDDNTDGGEGTIRIVWENAAGSPAKKTRRSYKVFRDPSAWYHLVFAFDSTQGTAADRLKVYVNNEIITSWRSDISEGDDPTLNQTFRWNANGETLDIGHHQANPAGDGAERYFEGYITEFHNIDGQQLTPSSFGQAGDYGEWKPIEVTGMTYGNN